MFEKSAGQGGDGKPNVAGIDVELVGKWRPKEAHVPTLRNTIPGAYAWNWRPAARTFDRLRYQPSTG